MLRSCFLTLLCSLPSLAAESESASVKHFESRIRPLFVEHCVGCHGPAKQKAELRLDSAEAIRKGGISGSLVVPADPAKSLLLKAVRHVDGVSAMPPSKKLGDRDIADLTRWIADGAIYPAPSSGAKANATHWAFVPPRDQPLPNVKDTAWIRTPIDRFILAKLEANGLQPAAVADQRTLIRRVTFDLTGLPPTPAEIDAFVTDSSSEALAKVVDRLLASSAYGERWGRHWLDVARYADSNGLDENIALGTAWKYRDYVIRSFNADKPFDQFVREQIAGDLIRKGNDFDPLIATGFLSLGPKVLAEVDEKKMEMDIVDEQLDTMGQAFMGITLGCARCHDHKFDPFSHKDYYALAGVFVSTKTMEHFKKIARWHENPISSPAEIVRLASHQQAIAELNTTIESLAAKKDEASKVELKKRKDELAALQKNAPEPTTAIGVTEGTVTDMPLLKRGSHLTPGDIVGRRFPTVLAGNTQPTMSSKESGRRELANWLTNPDHPLTARVLVNRVWRWHFGQGIVRSVDNFGKLGETPSHPELLDWLARRFVADGWSIKNLHRSIVLSATYRQASKPTDTKPASRKPQSVDPENRLLWHFARRRLEAEALRDSLLAVSGRLDLSAGGPAITHVKNREFLFDHTSIDGTKYDSLRRSVYLPVVRNNLYAVFQLFDSTDAAVTKGDRSTTTVATQALFYLNSELVSDCAKALATRLDGITNDIEQIAKLYELALGRSPSERETRRAISGIKAFEGDLGADEPNAVKRRAKALALFCQAVLSSNEFAYLE